eukprot:gene1575-4723_t
MSADLQSNFAAVKAEHSSGASIVVHPKGATLLSWTPAPPPPIMATNPTGSGVEVPLVDGSIAIVGGPGDVLFVSSKAVVQPGKAIRGGIPIVFPQFGGEGPLPSHGFARTSLWTVKEVGDGLIVLTLTDSPLTKKLWDNSFELTMTVTFDSSKCHSIFEMRNTGGDAVEVQSLLHTYFRLQHISAVTIEGLQGLVFEDKLKNFEAFEQKDKFVTFDSETDRVFRNVGHEQEAILTLDAGSGMWRRIRMRAEMGSDDTTLTPVPCDVVVWNPWIEKAKATADLDDDEYVHMVCVEPGCVRSKPTVPGGGGVFRLHQVISLDLATTS